VGARQNRVDELEKRAEYTKTNITELLAKTEGIDYAESIMDFKWLESVHQYALAIGARSIRTTLMDFLR
ncbi:MAG TPA: flagellar biosynthesis protein FlgL, partial [Spirochaetota bacterium]|nr:flagellar biosynthesis protein FlgL [Spirochaetota bacterium]